MDQVDNARKQSFPGHRPPNNLDLTASMNSNITATSSTTESTETGSRMGDGAVSQSNRSSFDYYAAATSQSSQVLMLCRICSLNTEYHHLLTPLRILYQRFYTQNNPKFYCDDVQILMHLHLSRYFNLLTRHKLGRNSK